jgi:hypothetical protein
MLFFISLIFLTHHRQQKQHIHIGYRDLRGFNMLPQRKEDENVHYSRINQNQDCGHDECIHEDRWTAFEKRLKGVEDKSDKIEEMFLEIKDGLSTVRTELALTKQRSELIKAAGFIILGVIMTRLVQYMW